jgi:Protein of unknown function with HXXEE motif
VPSNPSIDEAVARRRWGTAWMGLCLALALHVIDEAANDFLSVYNPLVLAARERFGFWPMPVFTFGVWFAGLWLGVAVLLALSPLVFKGMRFMRLLSRVFAGIMVANGVGHIAASIAMRTFAPGVYSSPLLLVAGIQLWRAVPRRVQPERKPRHP